MLVTSLRRHWVSLKYAFVCRNAKHLDSNLAVQLGKLSLFYASFLQCFHLRNIEGYASFSLVTSESRENAFKNLHKQCIIESINNKLRQYYINCSDPDLRFFFVLRKPKTKKVQRTHRPSTNTSLINRQQCQCGNRINDPWILIGARLIVLFYLTILNKYLKKNKRILLVTHVTCRFLQNVTVTTQATLLQCHEHEGCRKQICIHIQFNIVQFCLQTNDLVQFRVTKYDLASFVVPFTEALFFFQNHAGPRRRGEPRLSDD